MHQLYYTCKRLFYQRYYFYQLHNLFCLTGVMSCMQVPSVPQLVCMFLSVCRDPDLCAFLVKHFALRLHKTLAVMVTPTYASSKHLPPLRHQDVLLLTWRSLYPEPKVGMRGSCGGKNSHSRFGIQHFNWCTECCSFSHTVVPTVHQNRFFPNDSIDFCDFSTPHYLQLFTPK
jgi:hypothetical protein